MLDDAFAHLEREIEAGKIQIAPLELFDDAQRVQIVIEAVAEGLQQFVEPPLPGMPKRRMPDVVHQRQRLGQIRVEVQRPGHGAGHLRHFDGMRQPVAEMIGIARGEDLRLRFEAPERPRMNHAIAVPRVVVAVTMPRLRPAPPPRPSHVLRKSSQRHVAILCHGPGPAKPP